MVTAALLFLLLVFTLLASGTGWSNVLSPARNEVVFAGRNRSYGAYVMRREHHRTMLFAMLIGLGAIGTAVVLPTVLVDPGVEVVPVPPHIIEGPTLEIFDPPTVTPPVPKPPAPKPPVAAASTPIGIPETVDSTAAPVDTAAARTPDPVGPVGPPTGTPVPTPTGTGTTPSPGPAPVYANVAPEYPGGMEAFYEDIGNEVKYPAIDARAERQGQVRLVFIVAEDGSVSDIQVTRSVSPTLDAEAVRVFKRLKRWNPGTFQGEPVRTRYSIVMNFKLR